MSNQSQRWSDFWKGERKAFFEIMKLSTTVFAERFDAHFGTNKDHSILDYGCGPGFFIDCEIDKRTTISGVDINSYFVAECKRKYPGLAIFQIPIEQGELENSFHKLFSQKRFDFIVLLSVCQYFESKEQLYQLIQLLSKYLAGGGRLVIADVPGPDTSSVRDTLALLRHCLAKGKIPGLVKFINYLLFSEYGRISKREGLHVYTDDDFSEIARQTGLGYLKVNNLSLHPTRTNYVLTKP